MRIFLTGSSRGVHRGRWMGPVVMAVAMPAQEVVRGSTPISTARSPSALGAKVDPDPMQGPLRPSLHVARYAAGYDAVIHSQRSSNDPPGAISTRSSPYEINPPRLRCGSRSRPRRAGVRSASALCPRRAANYGAAGDEPVDEEAELKHRSRPTGESKVRVNATCRALARRLVLPPPSLRLRHGLRAPSPRLRFDIVLNNLVAGPSPSGKVFLKSDGTPLGGPIVHIEDIQPGLPGGYSPRPRREVGPRAGVQRRAQRPELTGSARFGQIVGRRPWRVLRDRRSADGGGARQAQLPRDFLLRIGAAAGLPARSGTRARGAPAALRGPTKRWGSSSRTFEGRRAFRRHRPASSS